MHIKNALVSVCTRMYICMYAYMHVCILKISGPLKNASQAEPEGLYSSISLVFLKYSDTHHTAHAATTI